MRIEYSKKFIKEFRKCPDNIQDAFKSRLKIFIADKKHPTLKTHKLTGELSEYKSFNITGDWRAIFQEINRGEVVYFVAIGTHSRLYG